ncbi:MAG: hypothetical protein ACRCS9_03555 [Hyphomicrobium sp.]
MPLADYARCLAALAETVYLWIGQLKELDAARREKVALYAEEVAATLARASSAFAHIERSPGDRREVLHATRELGRVAGYVETIVAALEHHLDGRKLAGVKRRLETLKPFEFDDVTAHHSAFSQARRLASAEGYFRALADALRT